MLTLSRRGRKASRENRSSPFAWLRGHGILTRFSSPGGEGMQTHLFTDSVVEFIVLTTRTPRRGEPLCFADGDQFARARSDGRNG